VVQDFLHPQYQYYTSAHSINATCERASVAELLPLQPCSWGGIAASDHAMLDT